MVESNTKWSKRVKYEHENVLGYLIYIFKLKKC